MAIDDTYYNLVVVRIILVALDVELICAKSGQEALEFVKTKIPDLILLDIMMPDMDGYEVCENFKKNPETSAVPIIFLSALDEIENKVKAFELGGVDYITKPFNTLEVVARVKTHIKLHHMLEEINTLLRESFHELYTPLGLIKSSLSLLELEQGGNEHTQNIKASVQSLHSIYEDMYYAIKKEVRSYPPEWLDIQSFLNKRMDIFKAHMEYKKLTYTLNSSIDSPMIHISLTELERLIDNLLSNAIKYANVESKIEIVITSIDNTIKLSISNESKKIKNSKKIFDKLYRETHSVMGLGIGLSIVKKICDKYHISIDVESEKNKTSFILHYQESQ